MPGGRWKGAYKVYGWHPTEVYVFRDRLDGEKEYVAAMIGALVDKVTTDPTRAKPVPTSYTFLLKKTGWTLTPEVLSADTPPGYFHPATAAYGVMYYALWEPSPGNFTRGVALKTDDSTWVDDELQPCDTPCGYLSSTVYAHRDVPGVGREYVVVTSGGPVVGSFEREGAKRIDVYYASDLVKAGWKLTPGHLPRT